ncbi:MAG: NAD-binding protein [Planctomycetota bacterium]
MKSIVTQLALFIRQRPGKPNVRTLLRFIALLIGMIFIFSVLFHYIMLREGQEHSWVTGFYWTLTVMSTLGFGDITFESDLGRAFSMFVLLSGVLFMLVLLPFTVIQFFYAPWIEARRQARAPDELPVDLRDHVIITRHDPVTAALINRLRRQRIDYVLLVPDRQEALRLHDEGLRVMVGQLDMPETYRNARLDQAALLVTTADDATDTKVIFVAREVAGKTPMIATVDNPRSRSVLSLAGAQHALNLTELVGESLAHRTIGGDAMTHVIDRLGNLQIAEANALRTPLVGNTIAENRIADLGVAVLGVWERGEFEVAQPDTVIGNNAVLVLGGTAEQLLNYDEAFAIYNVSGAPVVLIGCGRVGKATARALSNRGIQWCMIDRDPSRQADWMTDEQFLHGDAADVDVLKKAGIEKAPTVLITTHDDSTNVYLTLLLRDLRPDIQIISRATLEQNVRTLHRAGADFVMSTATLGASRIMNLLRHGSIVPIAEGLNIVRVAIPSALAGSRLTEVPVRKETGATVIATVVNGDMRINPNPADPLPTDGDLVLIGDEQTEQRFAELYGDSPA